MEKDFGWIGDAGSTGISTERSGIDPYKGDITREGHRDYTPWGFKEETMNKLLFNISLAVLLAVLLVALAGESKADHSGTMARQGCPSLEAVEAIIDAAAMGMDPNKVAVSFDCMMFPAPVDIVPVKFHRVVNDLPGIVRYIWEVRGHDAGPNETFFLITVIEVHMVLKQEYIGI